MKELNILGERYFVLNNSERKSILFTVRDAITDLDKTSSILLDWEEENKKMFSASANMSSIKYDLKRIVETLE